MWRLWNFLFGWQYIYWENSCDTGIERIRETNGQEYFMQYGKYLRKVNGTTCSNTGTSFSRVITFRLTEAKR